MISEERKQQLETFWTQQLPPIDPASVPADFNEFYFVLQLLRTAQQKADTIERKMSVMCKTGIFVIDINASIEMKKLSENEAMLLRSKGDEIGESLTAEFEKFRYPSIASDEE